MSLFEEWIPKSNLESVDDQVYIVPKDSMYCGYMHTLFTEISQERYVEHLAAASFASRNDFFVYYDPVDTSLLFRFRERKSSTRDRHINEKWKLAKSLIYSHRGTALRYGIDEVQVYRDDHDLTWFDCAQKLSAYGYWTIEPGLGHVVVGCRPRTPPPRHSPTVVDDDRRTSSVGGSVPATADANASSLRNWLEQTSGCRHEYFFAVITTNRLSRIYSTLALDRFVERFRIRDMRCINMSNIHYTTNLSN